MTTSRKKTDSKCNSRRYNVHVTAIYPVEIPASVAAAEIANGTLDHEILERFERGYGDRLDLDAIRQTKFFDSDCSKSWEPIYRLPPASRQNRPLNAQDQRRATRAYFTGGAEDIFVPVPDAKLPI